MTLSNLRRANRLIACAWVIHAVSWFLPVVRVGSYGSVRGWTAFSVAMAAVWPSAGVHAEKWYYAVISTLSAVISTLSAVTTVLFVLGSPWVVWRGSRSVQNSSAWAAAIAFVFNAHWYVLFGTDRKDLSIGYFLWWLSFSLLAIGLFGLSSQRAAGIRGEQSQLAT